jgi:hypothetical protein
MEIWEKQKLYDKLLDSSVVNPSNGCREWTLYKMKTGYGQFTLSSGKTYLAHRLMAYCKLGFDLNSKLYVCHKCNNPSCIEETHLYIGTQAKNLGDAIARGSMKNNNGNSSKLQCPRGHPYVGNNLRIVSGRRTCVTCVRLASKRYRERKHG